MSRICYNGLGQDNTAALKTFLATVNNPLTKFIYLIGEPDHPQAIWATDYESPLLYQPYGTFKPAVITRSLVTFKTGAEVQTCTLDWAPSNRVFTPSLAAASPLQLAAAHFYDNWPVRIWKVYMPTPGDCNTIGAVEWFGGVVAFCEIGRSGLRFNVKSYTYVLSQKTPQNVIEVTNTVGAYTAATAPPSSSVPVFTAFAGSSESVIYADCLTPSAGHIYGDGTFNNGFLVFLAVAGATLAGAWAVVGSSKIYTDPLSHQHNELDVYAGLPFPPTPGVDQFYVSKQAPINLGEEGSFGFPYVPNPESGA